LAFDEQGIPQCGERALLDHVPRSQGGLTPLGPAQIRERDGVNPKQVPDFIALLGDPSDKLPDACDAGPKERAADLLRRYGTPEASSLPAGFPHRRKCCGYTDQLPP